MASGVPGVRVVVAVGNEGGGATGSTGSNSCLWEQQAAREECQEYVKDPEISNFSDESVGNKTLC